MLCRDPRAPADADGRPDDYVDVKGDLVAVDSDGTFEHEAIDEQWARAYAERQGATYSEVVVESVSEKSRADLIEEGTCPWCVEEDADDPYEGDGVPQHASSAHPDEWDAFKAE